jgi:diguanylate cyclase (GGDEF)-like protein
MPDVEPPSRSSQRGGPAAATALEALAAASALPFDRIVRLAARSLGTAMASVTVLDGERAWSKAAVGLGVGPSARIAPFVAATVHAGDAGLAVLDAASDERFSDSEVVVAPPQVRFYAGAPLRLADGHAVGALAVFDRSPRSSLSAEDLETLRDLAAVVVHEIDLHARHHALAAAHEHAARQSGTDSLTGLANRRTLDDKLHGAIALARRTGHALALLLIDLDAGPATAAARGDGSPRGDLSDEDVIELAERLAAGVRAHDVVAHVGAGAFAVVLQAVDRAGVAEASGRIHELLSNELRSRAHGPGVGSRARVAIGVALHPADGEDIASLLRAADLAKHEAKIAGGGVRRFATP